MVIIIYIVISTVVGYITYEFKKETFKQELETYYSWIDCKSFWFIIVFTLLWFITIPVIFILWVLKNTLGKIIEQIKNKNK